MTNEIIPISDEQAKLGQEALKALQGLGAFLKNTLGTIPEDIVGLLGGDYLKVRRAENLSKIIQKAKIRLEQAGVEKTEPPALSLILPIFKAAADEDRDELQDIWAGLLASAADPTRKRAFRLKFIEIANKLDPLDVGLLNEISGDGIVTDSVIKLTQAKFRASSNEVQISIGNLTELGILGKPGSRAMLFPLGSEFLRAVR